MSDFKVKMHQIRFSWGYPQDPAGGAFSVPQTPQLYLWDLFLREEREKEGEGKGKGRDGRGGRGMEERGGRKGEGAAREKCEA